MGRWGLYDMCSDRVMDLLHVPVEDRAGMVFSADATNSGVMLPELLATYYQLSTPDPLAMLQAAAKACESQEDFVGIVLIALASGWGVARQSIAVALQMVAGWMGAEDLQKDWGDQWAARERCLAEEAALLVKCYRRKLS